MMASGVEGVVGDGRKRRRNWQRQLGHELGVTVRGFAIVKGDCDLLRSAVKGLDVEVYKMGDDA